MKLVQKTITLTLTVEHVSDDSAYEERLQNTVSSSITTLATMVRTELHDALASRNLLNPITAGGLRIDVETSSNQDVLPQPGAAIA